MGGSTVYLNLEFSSSFLSFSFFSSKQPSTSLEGVRSLIFILTMVTCNACIVTKHYIHIAYL